MNTMNTKETVQNEQICILGVFVYCSNAMCIFLLNIEFYFAEITMNGEGVATGTQILLWWRYAA